MLKSLLAVVVVAGCQVEVEVEDIRLTYHDAEIKGVGLGSAANRSFVFDDLSAIEELVDLGADVTFVGAELRATGGVESFSFIEQARITIASGDPAAGVTPVVVFDCAGDCATHGKAFAMQAAHRPHASDFVTSGSLRIDIDLVGHMPARAWNADFDVVLEARLDYTLEP